LANDNSTVLVIFSTVSSCILFSSIFFRRAIPSSVAFTTVSKSLFGSRVALSMTLYISSRVSSGWAPRIVVLLAKNSLAILSFVSFAVVLLLVLVLFWVLLVVLFPVSLAGFSFRTVPMVFSVVCRDMSRLLFWCSGSSFGE
ncbi:hypothetical protein GGU11DRAFT_212973, partial [Lentinula aff. detonsa]